MLDKELVIYNELKVKIINKEYV